MAPNDHSTVESVDNHDYDKEGPGRVADVDAKESSDFPEGGLRAWMTLVGSSIFQFCGFGYVDAFGVYNDYYIRIYLGKKYTSSQIGWIGSVQGFVILSMGLISGRAFDAGYFYHITIGGTILFAFSLFMLSLSRPEQYYQVFLAHGLANSIAIGMVSIPSLAIVSHYFSHRRAFAFGVSQGGAALGGTIHPIMLNQLFHGQIGFHNGVRASAAFTFCLMMIGILLMKPRLPPKQHNGHLLLSFWTFIREPAYVLVILGIFLNFMGIYFPLFFLQLKAIERNVNPTFAFYSLTILNGASIIGRIIPSLPAVVHKFGIINALLTCSICSAILIFCFLAVKSVVGVVLFASAYGFVNGAYLSFLASTLSVLAKRDSEIGERMGIGLGLSAVGALIGTPITGALLTSSYTWWKPTLFSGLVVGLGSICFFGARLFVVKEKGTIIV